ncbi:MAG TPA: hypothetical protein VIT85_08245 [Solirubrobacterales bacterium]
MAAWKLPLLVAAIVVPIVAGFYVGGASVGTALGALAVAAILVIAARARPRDRIEPATATDSRRHVLLVVTLPVEEPAAVASIVESGRLSGGRADVLVLAPARIGFLDRWASDVEGARRAAQENLVATVAALAKAGVEAEARVGDEDVLQAVEDQLQTYPATDVVLVTGEGETERQEAAIEELSSRLAPPLRRVELSG